MRGWNVQGELSGPHTRAGVDANLERALKNRSWDKNGFSCRRPAVRSKAICVK